ncbi:MAG: DNA polymerase III subunit delta' [Clostridia bacterium]|jgi:DNA polymerase-3 subunit delta'|nr:DNA polymerase III subunit delta' [Clostridia bacterium]
MIFENIIGNQKNKKILEDIIIKNKIANAYMFIGQESIGKFLFAKEFAKAILCLNENKPCNKCKSCLEFDNSNNPDLTIIEPDGNNVKIEQIRELNRKVVEKPIVSTKKVYIINDGQNITKEAQNALLKTLEEPPEYVTIILITTSESAFLPTIKSRCTKINFNKLTEEEMLKILKEKYNYQNVGNIVYKTSNGSISKSIQIIEKQSEFEDINKMFSNLEHANVIDLINSKEVVFKDKEDINSILDYIITIFFEKIKDNRKYIECIEIAENAKERLRKNSNYDMTIDNFMLNVWEEING